MGVEAVVVSPALMERKESIGRDGSDGWAREGSQGDNDNTASASQCAKVCSPTSPRTSPPRRPRDGGGTREPSLYMLIYHVPPLVLNCSCSVNFLRLTSGIYLNQF